MYTRAGFPIQLLRKVQRRFVIRFWKEGTSDHVDCANAIGQAVPPMVMFDGHNLKPAWTKGEFLGIKYGDKY